MSVPVRADKKNKLSDLKRAQYVEQNNLVNESIKKRKEELGGTLEIEN